jgi:hypothetical protein
MPPLPTVICREIAAADLTGVIALLRGGFPPKSKDAPWGDVFKKLAEHPTPPGLPKYGYLLESNGEPVGALLLIFSSVIVNGESGIRCNVSSWFVLPRYRSYAPLLSLRALKHKHVTYLNITPDPHTWPVLESQGYRRFSSGMFFAIPALRRSRSTARVTAATNELHLNADLHPFEIDVLLSHARYGCLSLICETDEGSHPFVFGLRWKFGIVPFVYLVYCRDLADVVRFAGPLGRFLLRKGIPLIALDSDGPIKELSGRYVDNQPKFFKGPERPRLGDVAYTERAMFGV